MTLLLLGGTGEGRKLAGSLAECELPVITSLAGTTRSAPRLPGRVRVGGFGGEAGFRQFLKEQDIRAILDATHPFAARISVRTADIASEVGLPYLQVLRPEWRPGSGDRWIDIDDESETEFHVPEGATVFVATGRQTLDRYANMAGRRLICRQIDPPDAPFPFPDGEFLVGRPPFSVDDEITLFRQLGVDWLVTKNSGGPASATKLAAAAALGITVLMVRRPPQPDAARVETVDDAMKWVRGLSLWPM